MIMKSSGHALKLLRIGNAIVADLKMCSGQILHSTCTCHLRHGAFKADRCRTDRSLCTYITKHIPVLGCRIRSVQISPYRATNKYYCSDHNQENTELQGWEMLVNYEKLSPLELKIHRRHSTAVKNGQLFYKDPVTSYQVMTRLAHIQRGECCGNECRHCPFGRVNVPKHKRTKTHNTAFYS